MAETARQKHTAKKEANQEASAWNAREAPLVQDLGAFAKKLLAPFASLRLTVVLFGLAIILVFCGTLAQREEGIWTVLAQYFRSLYVWIPLQIFFSHEWSVAGGFPFPGGWLLGGLLLSNLLAAHAVRFKVSWKRSGILLIHAGLIAMMLSEFVTGVWAVEGNMTIDQGGTSNYVENPRVNELAIVDPSDPKTDDVVIVPERMLRRGGVIQHDLLPFDVEVVRYMSNSALLDLQQAGGDAKKENPATAGAGLAEVAVPRPEVSGTDQEQKVDIASAYVTFKKKQTKEVLGTYLISLFLRSQPIVTAGKIYEVSLRPKRTYKPYSLHLIEFRHDKYIGTEKAKNFSSLVRLIDSTRNEDREVKIWMNHPLRHAGETFYQASFLRGDSGTVLQVVRNPGWLMPYLSCFMVSGGMLVHFCMHLYEFLRRRRMPR